MFSFLSNADTVNNCFLWTFPKRFQCSIVLPSVAVGLKWAVDFSASIVKKSLSRAHNIWNLTSKGFWSLRNLNSFSFQPKRDRSSFVSAGRSSSVKWKKVIWNYWHDTKVETAAGLQWIANTQSNRKEFSDGLEEVRTIRSETNRTCLPDQSKKYPHLLINCDLRRVWRVERRNLLLKKNLPSLGLKTKTH